MKLFSAEAMRAADGRALELGYPSILLMEAAGRAVAQEALKAYPEARKISVVCGKGNNGGDGFVAARWLHFWGKEVSVFAPPDHRGDAALARAALAAHLPIRPLQEFRAEGGDLLLDAVFGTGLSRPVQGDWAALIEKINASSSPVIAVDVPSGLPFQPHVKASLTVALAGLKHVHVFYPPRSACGKISLVEIGLPAKALQQPGLPEMATPRLMRGLLPTRPGNAHKGSVGRVLIVGGAREYGGAPALAALAAYKSGAGLVTVAYPGEAAVNPPQESVRLPVSSWTNARLHEAKADAIAVGMGGASGGAAAARAALKLRKPTVLDADALHPEVVAAYAKAAIPTIITPHPGEAARLLGLSAPALVADPLRYARELSQRFRSVAVLKGGPSVVCELDNCTVNSSGNPAMASGGTGDVLSGVIAALLAAGLSAYDAARLGVYLHGLAGDLCGNIGLLASELAGMLPEARKRLEKDRVRPYWQ